jgi:PAS domain S-box-containing protein
LYPLIQNWPTPSKTAETLLVRKAEDSVLFLNRLRHSINSPLSLSIPLTKVEVPAVQAILGAKGIYEGIDYRGVNVLSIILPIIETPWFMVAKVDSNEIFAELNARATLIFILTFFLILFFSALIAWFYHYRQRNIYRKLLESEVELHQSQEEFKATLYSIGDGVITTDKDGNVKRLNPVAEMLTGWKEKDAKGEKLEKVFNIISEETRKTVENPVFKVLKEGLIVGLANHTLLISKNGTEIPIADSGAPIKNSKGEIVGVVMVFRDQTEERKSHSAIIASETRYRRLFESAKDGILILDAETGKIMEVNPFLMQLLGFSQEQFLDKILWEIGLFKDIIANKDMFLELQQHEYVRYDNLPIETKAGKTIEVEFISNVYLVNGQKVIQCNIRDISQRKHSEKALKESEEKFSNILNNMTDVVWSLSWPELKPEFLSPSVEKLYGRPVLDFMENPTLFIETVHPDDKHLMDNALNQLKESGEAKRECRVIRPDGSIIWIYDKSKLIYDEKKQPVRVEGIAQDITELKQAERDLITLKNDLENKVKEKTKELNERVEELERFRDATIDRELRMKELRDEIKRLKGEI